MSVSVPLLKYFYFYIHSFSDEDESIGVTDDEGIEDDHDEGETSSENNDKPDQQKVNIRKSGTCDTLIALCR